MRTDKANIQEQASTHFEVLTKDQVKQIHDSSLEALASSGVFIESDEVLKMLEENGCYVKDHIVKVPQGLAEWAINSAPSHFNLYNQYGKDPLHVGGYNTYFGMGPTLMYMLDKDTGERRKFLKKDTEHAARVADALPNIEWVMGLGTISDVDPEASEVHEFDAMVRNTNKPLIVWNESIQGLKDVIKMAESVAGGKDKFKEAPFIASYSEPISPFVQNKIAVEKLMITAEHNIPTVHTPIPQGGASAPVTLAGELVSINTENLMSVVISQLRNPGSPIVIGGVIGIMDMMEAQLAYGAPEMQLMLAAYMDIAHYYEIPTWGTGGCTDSKLPDQQAGIEAAQSVLYSSLSGANLVHDPGYMASGLQGSLDMLVMVDEIANMAKFVSNGIKVNEDTLATEVINRVGPGGQYLTKPHTFKNFREQLWQSNLMDREPKDKWDEAGSKTMGDRIKEKIDSILKNHEVEPISKSAQDEIYKILSKY